MPGGRPDALGHTRALLSCEGRVEVVAPGKLKVTFVRRPPFARAENAVSAPTSMGYDTGKLEWVAQ